MKTSERGISLIQEFEGYRDRAYQDIVGVWTIGWGSTRFRGQKVAPGMRCTEAEALDQLKIDLDHFERAVNRLVKVNLSQNQFDALVSFAYNLGEGNLGSSTLLRKLNVGDYIGAAGEFERWNRAGGKVSNGLVRRRESEKRLFEGDRKW